MEGTSCEPEEAFGAEEGGKCCICAFVLQDGFWFHVFFLFLFFFFVVVVVVLHFFTPVSIFTILLVFVVTVLEKNELVMQQVPQPFGVEWPS